MWAYVLVALVGLYGVSTGVRAAFAMPGVVLPGFSYNYRLVGNTPVPPAAQTLGVAAGDRIVALDGLAVTSAGTLSRELAARGAGQRVHVTLRTTRGQLRPVTLDTIRPDLVEPSLRLLVGGAYVLVGLLLFWFYPGRRESWAFLLACVAVGLTLLTLLGPARTAQPLLDGEVGRFTLALHGVLFFHLFSVFPRPLPLVVRRPWLPWLLDGVMVAVGVAVVVANGMGGHAYPVLLVVATGANMSFVAVVLASMVWRLRRPQPEKDRAKLRALVVGCLVAFPLPAAIALIRALRWPLPNWVQTTLGPLPLLAFPLLVGYAMARSDLLQVDRAVARTSAYSASVLLLGGAYLGGVVLVPRVLAPASLAGSPTMMALVILGLSASLRPLKERLQRRIYLRLHEPDPDERLEEVREVLRDLATAPAAEVFARLERRIEDAASVPNATLVVAGADGGWRRPATGEAWTSSSETAPEKSVLGVAQVLPLRAGDELVGALGLGRANTPEPGLASQRLLEGLAVETARALKSRQQGHELGGYRVERFLASGGMGNIYLARKVGAAGFEKPVAIKQLLPHAALEPGIVERFLSEARIVARLTHPNIVQTLELGETDEGYFIAMEYIDGLDTSSLLRGLERAHRRMPLACAAYIVTSACLALDHAHSATDDNGRLLRLVHHDVTPHNILVSLEGVVKLADFGVAQVVDRPQEKGQLVGKPAYFAPEQLLAQPLDHRVDLFALGIVLYLLCTGSHPFKQPGAQVNTWDAIIRGRYLPPEVLREDCPPLLSAIIEKALARTPAERFQTAGTMAESLQNLYPMDSRTARELGEMVRQVQRGDEPQDDKTDRSTVTLRQP